MQTVPNPPPTSFSVLVMVPSGQPPFPVQNHHQDLDSPEDTMQHLPQAGPEQVFRKKTGIRLNKLSVEPALSLLSQLTYKAWKTELASPSSPEPYKLQHKFKFLKKEPPLGAEGWQPADFLRYTLQCTQSITHPFSPLLASTRIQAPPSL